MEAASRRSRVASPLGAPQRHGGVGGDQCARRRSGEGGGESQDAGLGVDGSTVMAIKTSYNWLFLWDEKHSINEVFLVLITDKWP